LKWFKHISDSLDDPFIFDLIDRFGGDGYMVFFGTLEIMSREFDIKAPGTCTVSTRFLTKKFQLSRQKTVKILNFCEKKGRVFADFNGQNVTLNCPKLKDMCDEWTKKKLRSDSGVGPDSLRPPREEEEVEGDKEEDKPPKVPPCPHKKIIELYHEILPELPRVQVWDPASEKHLKNRWQEDPKRQSLEAWKNFFKYVKKSDFMMGKVKNWKADLMWIVKPTNFAKILNGTMHKYQSKEKSLEERNREVLEDWTDETE